MAALDSLRGRLAELADLGSLARLAGWDQRTMMPPAGGTARAYQMAAISRLAHDRGTAEEIGAWLDAIDGDDLGDVDRDLVRVARRDWERERRVPADLAAERAQASAEGQAAWQSARAASDFAAFVPALRRNLELARAYADCLDDGEHPYDALLADYDWGLTASRIQEIFGPLAEALPPLVAAAAARPDPPALEIPIKTQQAAVRSTLARLGVDDERWRIDVSPHPFSTSMSRDDLRVTTRYERPGAESLLAALHEFGHALYEGQIAPELGRTNLGHGTSMSIHESQSKLWENHVARNGAFAPVLAAEVTAGGFPVEPDALHAVMTHVRPSLIRVEADQVTYPLHIVLRFELELALVEGSLDIADLPTAWNDGMRRLLGVEVPDDAVGVLQDVHWGVGSFGYFPSYALGCLIAAQLWEQLESELGSRDEALAAADVGAIRDWLGEHIHRYGRRLDTEPLVQQATSRGIDAAPFLRYAAQAHIR
ncbi:MAG TPA: carboxypeptidase M32 [Solirubrobacteraceae bacterium]|nr:carboxypeptidase M32 [Solirubrobacteraceae bacterium]